MLMFGACVVATCFVVGGRVVVLLFDVRVDVCCWCRSLLLFCCLLLGDCYRFIFVDRVVVDVVAVGWACSLFVVVVVLCACCSLMLLLCRCCWLLFVACALLLFGVSCFVLGVCCACWLLFVLFVVVVCCGGLCLPGVVVGGLCLWYFVLLFVVVCCRCCSL